MTILASHSAVVAKKPKEESASMLKTKPAMLVGKQSAYASYSFI